MATPTAIFEKAQKVVAGKILESLRGSLDKARVMEFIPDCGPDSELGIEVGNLTMPVMAGWLPAGAVPRGGTLTMSTKEHMEDLHFLHQLFLYVDNLPRDMRDNLVMVSATLFDVLPDQGDQAAPEVDVEISVSDPEEVQSLTLEEEILFSSTNYPRTGVHPNKNRRLLGVLFMFQEIETHRTYVNPKEFPLSNTRGLSTRERDEGSGETQDEEEEEDIDLGADSQGLQDDASERGTPPSTPRPKKKAKKAAPKNKKKPPTEYRVPLPIAIKEIAHVWDRLLINETEHESKPSSQSNPLTHKLSHAMPKNRAGAGALDVAHFKTYSDLFERAQELLPGAFDGDNLAETDRKIKLAQHDASILFDYSNVIRAVDARTGYPVSSIFRAQARHLETDGPTPSGSRERDRVVSQGEYSMPACADEGHERRAFGVIVWKWTMPTGPYCRWLDVLTMRIPLEHFHPPLPYATALQHVLDVCQTNHQDWITELENMSTEEQVHRVYYLLFGPYFGHEGQGPTISLAPSKLLSTSEGAISASGSENIVKSLTTWAKKGGHKYDPASVQGTATSIHKLVDRFTKHLIAQRGVFQLCVYPQRNKELPKKFMHLASAEHGFFQHLIHETLHNNGLQHNIAYVGMFPFLAYGGSGHSSISHLLMQGMTGTGKSMILSIHKALVGLQFIADCTDAVVKNLPNPQTFACHAIVDEIPPMSKAEAGSMYSTGPVKNALNNALENKEFNNYARVMESGKGYTSEVTACGKPHLLLAMGTNEALSAVDASMLDRYVYYLTMRHLRPDIPGCVYMRSLCTKDIVLDELLAVDLDNVKLVQYLAQAVRLKGFAELMLDLPTACTDFVGRTNVEKIHKRYFAEGGGIDGARLDGVILELANVMSCYEAVCKSLYYDQVLLKGKTGLALFASLVAGSARFHIPTGVTYVQVLSYLHDECEGSHRHMLIALAKQALIRNPSLLVDTWHKRTVTIKAERGFNLADYDAINEMFKQQNYMEPGKTTVQSIHEALQRFESADDSGRRMVVVSPGSVEISYEHLQHCFTSREIDILGAVCALDFVAPFADVLKTIAYQLKAEAAIASLSRPGTPANSECFPADSMVFGEGEDSMQENVSMDVTADNPETGDENEEDSTEGGEELDERAEDHLDAVRRWKPLVRRAMKGSAYASIPATEVRFYCEAFGLLREFADSYTGMMTGGDPLISLQYSTYWDVSVSHLASHPLGLFDTAWITFSAEELYNLIDPDEAFSLFDDATGLAAYLDWIPQLGRHKTTAHTDPTLYIAYPADFRSYIASPLEYRSKEVSPRALSVIWNAIGEIRAIFVSLKEHIHLSVANRLAVKMSQHTTSMRGADIVSDPRFRDLSLTVRNMTRRGTLPTAELADFSEVQVSKVRGVEYLTMHVDDIRRYKEESRAYQVLSDLFEQACYLTIHTSEGILFSFNEECTVVCPIPRDAELPSFTAATIEFIDSQDSIVPVKHAPCIVFKPGYLTELHPSFACVLKALMTHGEGSVHAEILLRTIHQTRKQHHADVTEIDQILRFDEIISRYASRVRKESNPAPVKASMYSHANPLAKGLQTMRDKAAGAQRREDASIAEHAAAMETEPDRHQVYTPPGWRGPDDSRMDEVPAHVHAKAPLHVGPTTQNFLELHCRFFRPDIDTFVFPTDYVCDLFQRILPPSARTLRAMSGFSPFYPPRKRLSRERTSGMMTEAPDMPADTSMMTFNRHAVLFVPLGCANPFCPGEQLCIPYSPFTTGIRPHCARTRARLNPDEAVMNYQSQFKEYYAKNTSD